MTKLLYIPSGVFLEFPFYIEPHTPYTSYIENTYGYRVNNILPENYIEHLVRDSTDYKYDFITFLEINRLPLDTVFTENELELIYD